MFLKVLAKKANTFTSKWNTPIDDSELKNDLVKFLIHMRDFQITPAVRKLAIFSLAELTRKYRHVLLPVFASIVHNPAETRGVRIAAFTMMVRMQPSTVHLQKLAVATWFRPENHPEDSNLRDSTIQAKIVLLLAKAVPVKIGF